MCLPLSGVVLGIKSLIQTTHERDDWALVLLVVVVREVGTNMYEIINHFLSPDEWKVIAEYCSVQERN